MRIRSRQKQESAIRMTVQDQECLAEVIQGRWSQVSSEAGDLLRLQNILDQAEAGDGVSAETIILNSRVVLTNADSGQQLTYTLVLPFHADVSEGRVSVLTPIGTAMLGRKTGESIHVKLPNACGTFRIEKVIPPPRQPQTRNTLVRSTIRAYPQT